MWRQQRADRVEAEVLATRERRPDKSYLGGYPPASPLGWDAARFSAAQRQQARLDRALFRLMDELDRLAPVEEDKPANPCLVGLWHGLGGTHPVHWVGDRNAERRRRSGA